MSQSLLPLGLLQNRGQVGLPQSRGQVTKISNFNGWIGEGIEVGALAIISDAIKEKIVRNLKGTSYTITTIEYICCRPKKQKNLGQRKTSSNSKKSVPFFKEFGHFSVKTKGFMKKCYIEKLSKLKKPPKDSSLLESCPPKA